MPDHILSTWNKYGYYTAILLIAAGLSLVLSHYLKLLFTSDKKSRYDYITKNEIKRFVVFIFAFCHRSNPPAQYLILPYYLDLVFCTTFLKLHDDQSS